MSDDLISRKETEKILREYADDVDCNRGQYELANGILKAVCRLNDPEIVPTAYDMDKVIEKIRKIPHGAIPNVELEEEIIEIVKSGGFSDE